MPLTLGDIAERYVRDYGFALIPLREKAKEPATRHGLKDWTDDPDGVKEGFDKKPKSNIGIVLGEPSHNVIVIDVDVDSDKGYDGMDFLLQWEREHGDLPETATAITGRGGYHLYFRADRKIRPSVNEDVHIDIRGEGSYVMAPPSVHPNGNITTWEYDPSEYEIAEADENVYAFIEAVRPANFSDGKKYNLPKEIKAGEGRNDHLFRYGASMRSQEVPDDVIAAAIIGANATVCKPPLDNDEVEKITTSVLALKPGFSEEVKSDLSDGAPKKEGGQWVLMWVPNHNIERFLKTVSPLAQ